MHVYVCRAFLLWRLSTSYNHFATRPCHGFYNYRVSYSFWIGKLTEIFFYLLLRVRVTYLRLYSFLLFSLLSSPLSGAHKHKTHTHAHIHTYAHTKPICLPLDTLTLPLFYDPVWPLDIGLSLDPEIESGEGQVENMRLLIEKRTCPKKQFFSYFAISKNYRHV